MVDPATTAPAQTIDHAAMTRICDRGTCASLGALGFGVRYHSCYCSQGQNISSLRKQAFTEKKWLGVDDLARNRNTLKSGKVDFLCIDSDSPVFPTPKIIPSISTTINSTAINPPLACTTTQSSDASESTVTFPSAPPFLAVLTSFCERCGVLSQAQIGQKAKIRYRSWTRSRVWYRQRRCKRDGRAPTPADFQDNWPIRR